MTLRVDVNFDKMLSENFRDLNYKTLMVLKYILEGKSNEEIAKKFLNTKDGDTGVISYHKRRIKEAFDLETDIELAMVCYERGYVTIEEVEDDTEGTPGTGPAEPIVSQFPAADAACETPGRSPDSYSLCPHSGETKQS